MAEPPASARAAPGTERRVLGATPRAWGPGRHVSTVREPFWHLTVDAPQALVAGRPAQLGLTIRGREALADIEVYVIDARGRRLGEAARVAVVAAGGQAEVSLPVTVGAAGRQELYVVLEAAQPEVVTRVPVTVQVRAVTPPGPATVSLVLRDVPLRQAATAIGRRAQVKVEVAPSLAELTVDCTFADPITAEAALRLLAEQVGGHLVKTAGGWRISEAGADENP
jgi:hypothetical protein